jgi:TolA-binding protein
VLVKRQILHKCIVTPRLKSDLQAEVNAAIEQIDQQLNQMEVQARRLMLDLQRTDLQRAMAFRQQVDVEKRRQEDARKELQQRLEDIASLEMGSEFVRGVLEGYVDLNAGDNVVEKLGRAEILTEDDIIREVRDPAPAPAGAEKPDIWE